jgi:hypothetical protein
LKKKEKFILFLNGDFIGRRIITDETRNKDMAVVTSISLFNGYNNRKSKIEHKGIEPDEKFK